MTSAPSIAWEWLDQPANGYRSPCGRYEVRRLGRLALVHVASDPDGWDYDYPSIAAALEWCERHAAQQQEARP